MTKRARGRPRKEITRDCSVHVRLTSDVYDRLQARAKAAQSSVASVVSLAIERELKRK